MGLVGAGDLVGGELSVLIPGLLLRVQVDRYGALTEEGGRELADEAGVVRKPLGWGGDSDDGDFPLRALRKLRNLRRFGLAGASEGVKEHHRNGLALQLCKVGRAVDERRTLGWCGEEGGPKGGERGESSCVHAWEASAARTRQRPWS